MWPSEIDAVFILAHKDKEKNRYERLQTHFESHGVPKDKIIFCAPTWGDQLSNSLIFGAYDPFCRQGMPILTFKARSLSKGEISLVLNFYAACQTALQRGFKKILIFESDTWLRESFLPRFNDLLADVKDKEWDYISLGEGARTRPKEVEKTSMYSPTKAYPPNHQFVYRCTDSMLFKVEYLAKILPTLIPFRECLDWELNVQSMSAKGKSLWADPPLAEQGTAVGRQETTLTA